MKIHRNYKFRLYPNQLQIDLLENHFFSSNQAWNHAFQMKKEDLERNSIFEKKDRNYQTFKEIYHTCIMEFVDYKNTIQFRDEVCRS